MDPPTRSTLWRSDTRHAVLKSSKMEPISGSEMRGIKVFAKPEGCGSHFLTAIAILFPALCLFFMKRSRFATTKLVWFTENQSRLASPEELVCLRRDQDVGGITSNIYKLSILKRALR